MIQLADVKAYLLHFLINSIYANQNKKLIESLIYCN